MQFERDAHVVTVMVEHYEFCLVVRVADELLHFFIYAQLPPPLHRQANLSESVFPGNFPDDRVGSPGCVPYQAL